MGIANRHGTWRGFVALFAVPLLACGGGTSGGGTPAANGKAIVIGVMAPFTGDYAEYGIGYQHGIDVWHKVNGNATANGHPIETRQIDDGCDVTTGLAAYRKQAQELAAVIGPACSSEVKGLAPVLEANKTPALFLGHAASLTTGQQNGWLFRVTQPDSANQLVFAEFILKLWKDQGRTNVALMHDTSTTDAGAPAAWGKAVKSAGVNLVDTEAFDLNVKDYTSQILKIRQSGAQALILMTFGSNEAAIIKQMHDLGLTIPVASAEDTPYPETIKAAGPSIEGTYFYSDYVVGSDNAALKKFAEAYQALFPGVTPLDVDYEGYIAVDILVKAIQKSGGDIGDKLRQALTTVKVPLGDITISFAANGDQEQLLTYVGQVKNGKPSLVKLVVVARSSISD